MTDRRINRPTDQPTDGHTIIWRCENATKIIRGHNDTSVVHPASYSIVTMLSRMNTRAIFRRGVRVFRGGSQRETEDNWPTIAKVSSPVETWNENCERHPSSISERRDQRGRRATKKEKEEEEEEKGDQKRKRKSFSAIGIGIAIANRTKSQISEQNGTFAV